MFIAGSTAVIAPTGCHNRKAKTPSYHGTVIIGGDYVQVLATVEGHRECKPRIQSANQCVRSPPSPDASCAKVAPCIEGIEIRSEGYSATARGPFVRAPWLGDVLESTLVVVIRGCVGNRELSITPGPQPTAFSKNQIERSAAVGSAPTSPTSRLTWAAPDHTDRADLVCALWRSNAFSEVCCTNDVGSLNLSTVPQVHDVRLSRGRLLGRDGRLEIYRTTETANMLEDPR